MPICFFAGLLIKLRHHQAVEEGVEFLHAWLSTNNFPGHFLPVPLGQTVRVVIRVMGVVWVVHHGVASCVTMRSLRGSISNFEVEIYESAKVAGGSPANEWHLALFTSICIHHTKNDATIYCIVYKNFRNLRTHENLRFEFLWFSLFEPTTQARTFTARCEQ